MSYRNGTGAEEVKLAKLHDLIDDMMSDKGEVCKPWKNSALERLRKMKNAYYRLFNDGDANGRLLGVYSHDVPTSNWGTPRQQQRWWANVTMTADAAMDAQILAAWKEQTAFGNVK